MKQSLKWTSLCFVVWAMLTCPAQAGEITRLWLTHQSNHPDHIVVNWSSDEPGDSVVRFGLSEEYTQTVRIDEQTTLHHVEIPLTEKGATYHYQVSTGEQQSADAVFQAYPTDVLRVAVVADWQSRPDLTALQRDKVHLLVTAGDQIPNLWSSCGAGQPECIEPYLKLIDTYPELFRSTPFLPVLGNHDREVHPRGSQPPVTPVYDVEATAFRRMFPLPNDGWKWHFNVPEFDLRLIALDLNHVSDFGTTWQTCHAFDEQSEQFQWYEKQMHDPQLPGYVVTFYNERNATVRNLARKRWQALLQRSSCCVTGFGYFAERAEVEGVPYYNTALNGRGTPYPDPQARFFASEDSYLLLTLPRLGPLSVMVKNLKGEVLDHKSYPRKTD